MTTHSQTSSPERRRSTAANVVLASALALSAIGSLSGCVAVLAGGAVGGGLLLTDRRTSGTQLEDEGIELKAGGRVREAISDRGHVNVTSYNRIVLISGEVPSDADKEAVGKAIGAIENVTTVVNELAVSGNSSLTSRSSDAVITGRVKGAFIDAKDVQANAIKVVTERGNVYLMGRVTEKEADRAAQVARDVGGVLKVVRVFDILSEDQLKALTNR
jgi:osmotically-inducible protein OsmY